MNSISLGERPVELLEQNDAHSRLSNRVSDPAENLQDRRAQMVSL